MESALFQEHVAILSESKETYRWKYFGVSEGAEGLREGRNRIWMRHMSSQDWKHFWAARLWNSVLWEQEWYPFRQLILASFSLSYQKCQKKGLKIWNVLNPISSDFHSFVNNAAQFISIQTAFARPGPFKDKWDIWGQAEGGGIKSIWRF
jgi:hypothetical protein